MGIFTSFQYSRDCPALHTLPLHILAVTHEGTLTKAYYVCKINVLLGVKGLASSFTSVRLIKISQCHIGLMEAGQDLEGKGTERVKHGKVKLPISALGTYSKG